MTVIGNKKRIAFDIGAYYPGSKQQQHIRTWVGNKSINPLDDIVYLPSFYSKLAAEIERLESNDFSRPEFSGLEQYDIFDRLEQESTAIFQVLSYDLSTCAAICYYIEYDSKGVILLKFWDHRHEPAEEIGKVFSVEISKEDMIKTMKEALNNLSDAWV